jgi:hypothetical protein
MAQCGASAPRSRRSEALVSDSRRQQQQHLGLKSMFRLKHRGVSGSVWGVCSPQQAQRSLGE